MTTATEERSQLQTEPVDRPAAPPSTWLLEPGALSTRWVAGLAVLWFVVFFGSVWLEPAPADPDAAAPIWSAIVQTAFFGTVLAMMAGFTGRSRLGALASFAGAGVFLTMVVACPVTAHHAIGAWWYAQLAGGAAVGTASLAALRS